MGKLKTICLFLMLTLILAGIILILVILWDHILNVPPATMEQMFPK